MQLDHFTKYLPLIAVCCILAGCASQHGVADNPAPFTQDAPKPLKEYKNPGMVAPEKATETAPDKFKVKFETTKGDFVIEVTREWSPRGADRFYNLVKIGYFEDVLFFRCVKGFMCQFGIHGDPAVNAKWQDSNINDDKSFAGVSNTPGTLTFAKTGAPNSRSVQFFINAGNNGFLDNQGFTPVGKVVTGMDNFMKLNTEYGERTTNEQGKFNAQGNSYMMDKFPNVDRIKKATLMSN